MSRLKPLVGERFKSKSQKYNEITIRHIGNHLYEIVGIKRKGNTESIEPITNKPHSLAMARLNIYKQLDPEKSEFTHVKFLN